MAADLGADVRQMALALRPFQRRFIRGALASHVDTAALSIPRGNGKSWLAAHLLTRCLTPGDVLNVPGMEYLLCQVHTDGWTGYDRVQAHGYRHRITYLSEHPQPANELLPRVHLIASLLKRWLLGTHQGAVSPAHLDYYLDEFTFRFNRRRSRHRGMLFYRLAQQAVQVNPVPYIAMVKDVGWGPRRHHKM